jgi:hypothetical protein
MMQQKIKCKYNKIIENNSINLKKKAMPTTLPSVCTGGKRAINPGLQRPLVPVSKPELAKHD